MYGLSVPENALYQRMIDGQDPRKEFEPRFMNDMDNVRYMWE